MDTQPSRSASDRCFKRGQVVQALWQLFNLDPQGPPPSKAFTAKIRNFDARGVPIEVGEKPGQPGIDQFYSEQDAFELALGLVFEDIGLKIEETAEFLRR